MGVAQSTEFLYYRADGQTFVQCGDKDTDLIFVEFHWYTIFNKVS